VRIEDHIAAADISQVANHVRDDLIATRGRQDPNDTWKPIMEVDQNGIPHAFCVRELRFQFRDILFES